MLNHPESQRKKLLCLSKSGKRASGGGSSAFAGREEWDVFAVYLLTVSIPLVNSFICFGEHTQRCSDLTSGITEGPPGSAGGPYEMPYISCIQGKCLPH